jgi:hypothetical protein
MGVNNMNDSQSLKAGDYVWGTKITHKWGSEYNVGKNPHMVRIYDTRKGIKIDFSQVFDKTWSKWQAIIKKYPDVLNIRLEKGTDLVPIIKWLVEEPLPTEYFCKLCRVYEGLGCRCTRDDEGNHRNQ